MRRLLFILGTLACGRVESEPHADRAGGSSNASGGVTVVATGGAAATSGGEATTANGGSIGVLGDPEEATGANRNALPPNDPRPPRAGASPETFCNTQRGDSYRLSLRADPNAVYTAVSVRCAEDSPNPCTGAGLQLEMKYLGSSGWQTQLVDRNARSQVVLGALNDSGVETLLGYSTRPFAMSNDVTQLGGERLVALPQLGGPVGAAFGMNSSELAGPIGNSTYLLSYQPSRSVLYRLMSGEMQYVGSWEATLRAVWGDANSIAIAGNGGRLIVDYFEKEMIFPRTGSPLLDFGSVWGGGQGGARAWAGTGDGRIAVVQGNEMTLVSTGSSAAVAHLWGKDDVLYYITEDEFGRLVGDVVEPLLHGTDFSFQDMWGISANEVFLAVSEPAADAFRCGRLRVLRYVDGNVEEF